MSIITLDHPGGRVHLDVPRDVAIGELMEDFLDITGQSDRSDWVLSDAGGQVCPAERTLAELGVADGSVLVLHTPDLTRTDPAPASRGWPGRRPARRGTATGETMHCDTSRSWR